MPIIRATVTRSSPALAARALLALALTALVPAGPARADKPAADQNTGRYIVAYDATGSDAASRHATSTSGR